MAAGVGLICVLPRYRLFSRLLLLLHLLLLHLRLRRGNGRQRDARNHLLKSLCARVQLNSKLRQPRPVTLEGLRLRQPSGAARELSCRTVRRRGDKRAGSRGPPRLASHEG